MKVYIEGSGTVGYQAMFTENGWEVVGRAEQADLLCFTGGEDVSPLLYREKQHPTTRCNTQRDQFCVELFHIGLNNDIPMVGICRGAQFLNIMCDGGMWQHVDGHATGKNHTATDILTGESIAVTSTHHQMMIPGQDAEIILIADETTRREYNSTTTIKHSEKIPDIEALYYDAENVFCFQPHPEYLDYDHPCVRFFFSCLTQYLYD